MSALAVEDQKKKLFSANERKYTRMFDLRAYGALHT